MTDSFDRWHSLHDLAAAYGPFQVALIDPPWWHRTWSDRGRSRAAERHYKGPPLSDDEIKSLPIAAIMAKNSAVFLWTTNAKTEDAIAILRHWGFPFSTLCPWGKVRATGIPTGPDWWNNPVLIEQGTGHWWRNSSELLLVGKRKGGKMPGPRQHLGLPGLILAPTREHSRKPDRQYRDIEQMFGPDMKRIELFSRTDRPGWVAWGFEAGKFGDGAA